MPLDNSEKWPLPGFTNTPLLKIRKLVLLRVGSYDNSYLGETQRGYPEDNTKNFRKSFV